MGSRIGRWTLAVACLLVVAGTAEGAPPQDATYQGLLLDSVGDPLVGPVNIEVGIWDSLVGGTLLYGETHSSVALEDGVFNLLLGTGSVLVGSFDAELFVAQNRYLEVTVNTEVLVPRQPFSSVAYSLRSDESEAAAYAATAGDADTVDGSHAAALDQSAHVSDTGNPHGVTAAQTGASTPEDVTSKVSTHAAIASVHHDKTTSFTELSGQVADGQIPSSIARDSERTWGNLSGIPVGFADGVDDTGITSESDPQVGSITTNRVPVWSGSALTTGSIVDTWNGFNPSVGIGHSDPHHPLQVMDYAPQLTYPLKLDNDAAGIGTTAVGILFSTEGNNGVVTPTRGKGALVYRSTGTWNRGAFYFLQDSVADSSQPTITDAVVAITNAGNLGIGTTNPQARLDVQDLARIRGNTWPAGGTGGSLELAYNSGANRGYLQAYDRTSDEFGEIFLGADEITRPVKEGILRIPPAAFHGKDANWTLWSNSSTYVSCSGTSTCRGAAAVDLPDGATVTRLVTYWYEHNAGDDASAYLTREDPSGSYPPDDMAESPLPAYPHQRRPSLTIASTMQQSPFPIEPTHCA